MTAGLIVALMITPIITSITREVFLTVPRNDKDGALALGASRWEMIRGVVLPHSSGGIVGAVMLGLGRAMGETIAIALVIGANPQIVANLFAAGRSDAVGDRPQPATSPSGDYQAALIGLGVVLVRADDARQRAAPSCSWRRIDTSTGVADDRPRTRTLADAVARPQGSAMSAGRPLEEPVGDDVHGRVVPRRRHPARVRPRDGHQQGHSPSSASTGSRRTSPTSRRAALASKFGVTDAEPVVYGMAPAIVGTLLTTGLADAARGAARASSARST